YTTLFRSLRKAHEHVDEIVNGNAIDTEITFKDYYLKWLEVNDKNSLSKGAYAWYERSLRYFLEEFGEDKLLRNITRSEYQLFINKYSKGRTYETVKKLNNCLRQPIEDAVYERYLEVDPTYKVKINATENARKEEDKFPTEEQYLELIED